MWVIRHSGRPPRSQRLRELGRIEGREEANGEVKSEGAERDEGQEEEILQHEGLGVQYRCVCGGAGGEGGGCAWERQLLDARPCQVDIEEEEQDAEAEDGTLRVLAERRSVGVGVGVGVYVESVVFAAEAVEEEVSVDLSSQLPCIVSSAIADVLAA